MFSRFFIDRPIFASVLSIIITLVGGMAMFSLPLAQFPRIAPPNINVTCNYPGASAIDVAQSVAAPIEQFLNGVEGMMYMSSQCTNDGTYNLSVTFEQGIDLNMAQVLVQNRINLALPILPDVIKRTGITTRKRSPDILLVMCVTSPKGRYGQLYLSNYAYTMIRDELSRVDGVSDVILFGQRDYAMRLWVDPDKMAYRNISATDVVNAVRGQNTQIATGMIGQPPTKKGQPMQITLDVVGRLTTVEQFENMVVKSTEDGRIVRVRDIGWVELGAKNADVNLILDGQPCVGLALFQLPDANALETADRCLAKMEELKKSFPDDVDYVVSLNTTPYTRESIREVFKTLRDAIILVAVVVLLFLQNWRSAIIPLIAVPVAIIGTFSVLAAIGFSLNNLTLFGLVLAIGIVVDDAIVVVEAVEHHIENGLSPRDATILAMEQVSGPVIAVALVLTAVFVPCLFISGITGMFFRQFAWTIAASTIISAFNSLTLSPALTAMLLRPLHHDKNVAPPLPRAIFVPLGGLVGWLWGAPALAWGLQELAERTTLPWASQLAELPEIGHIVVGVGVASILGWFFGPALNRLLAGGFGLFNRGFKRMTNGYTGAVGKMLRVYGIVLAVYAGLVFLTLFGFVTTPKGFIPAQDMGRMFINVQLPDSASLERTMVVMQQCTQIVLENDNVEHCTAVGGQSFALNAYGSNFGSMFVGLKQYEYRRDWKQSSDAVIAFLRKQFAERVFDAEVAVFGPPAVAGVGKAGGFAFVLEDREDLGPQALQEQVENLVGLARQNKDLTGVFSVFRANVPQLRVDVDERECLSKGVSIAEFANTLSVLEGSLYVNDFNFIGRTWEVVIQADASARTRVENLSRLKTRNRKGDMVPLGALASVRPITGPLILNRYNMYPAATIQGTSALGVSSREAIDLMIRLADRELPRSFAYEWTDMSYLEVTAGNTAMAIFALSVLMVFLVLAAQYESWSLPLAVILVVPLCLLSAIIGVILASMDINIFTQIGFVVLVGLSSKNAVLIVEFAKKQREAGVSRMEATLQACRLRLRPIIMTSLAFILGVLPLMIAHGAGAEMRRTLGTAVFAGMVGVTLFGIFVTPVFFYVINMMGEAPSLNTPAMKRVRKFTLGLAGGAFFGPFYLAKYAAAFMTKSIRRAERDNGTNG